MPYRLRRSTLASLFSPSRGARRALPAGALAALAALGALHPGPAAPAPAAPLVYPVAPVDVDDDDGDGVRDAAAIRLAAENFVDFEELREAAKSPRPDVDLGEARASLRLVAGGSAIDPARLGRGAGAVHVQGLRPGRARVRVGDRELLFRFVEARFVDAAGRPIDAAISGVPLSRTPPARPLATSPEGVRVLLVGSEEDLPATLALASVDGNGRVLDAQPSLELGRVACPEDVGPGLSCRTTAPVRPVFDEVDRAHPLATERSLQAELGGALVVRAHRRKLAAVRVVGPRDADVGPIDRLRAQLRVLLVRERAGGAPPFGVD
ncbi:MAG TPA: hypothetical protein VFS00_14865, partial [Polyangiaceae bacterium]|nr:hypothetical protein [Polyangiaceae bacterium]